MSTPPPPTGDERYERFRDRYAEARGVPPGNLWRTDPYFRELWQHRVNRDVSFMERVRDINAVMPGYFVQNAEGYYESV